MISAHSALALASVAAFSSSVRVARPNSAAFWRIRVDRMVYIREYWLIVLIISALLVS